MTATTDHRLIYHVCRCDEWEKAQRDGAYAGSSQDRADGFIHLSAPDQLKASVSKHRAGQDGLVLLRVDPDRLGDAVLEWEPSRGGALFPHVYGELPVDAVVRADDLPLGEDGMHRFPSDFAEDG